jgi:REP element-mobilizing transposase RayT
MKQGADRDALKIIGKKDLFGLKWYRDHAKNDLADQDLTAVLIASHEAHIYFLVLLPKDGQVYERVGLAIGYSFRMQQPDIRFAMFDSTVLERHNNNESWEGCAEYEEFTII